MITGQIIIRHQGKADQIVSPGKGLVDQVRHTRAGRAGRELILVVGILAVPAEIAARFGSIRGRQYPVVGNPTAALYEMMGESIDLDVDNKLTLAIHRNGEDVNEKKYGGTPSAWITSPMWRI